MMVFILCHQFLKRIFIVSSKYMNEETIEELLRNYEETMKKVIIITSL
jgi:hypothetical protein